MALRLKAFRREGDLSLLVDSIETAKSQIARWRKQGFNEFELLDLEGRPVDLVAIDSPPSCANLASNAELD